MHVDFKKYIKDGKVAVLYSPGYGAGWASWNKPEDFFLFDSGLVELALNKASETQVEDYLKGKVENPCLLGWGQISVEWLAEGESFRLHEYDGYESIRSASEDLYTA